MVVQSDLLDDEHLSSAVLPITSHLIPASYLRVDVGPEGGVLVRSQTQIDKPHTVARAKIGAVIGDVGRAHAGHREPCLGAVLRLGVTPR